MRIQFDVCEMKIDEVKTRINRTSGTILSIETNGPGGGWPCFTVDVDSADHAGRVLSAVYGYVPDPDEIETFIVRDLIKLTDETLTRVHEILVGVRQGKQFFRGYYLAVEDAFVEFMSGAEDENRLRARLDEAKKLEEIGKKFN